jgi:hypothetical protein
MQQLLTRVGIPLAGLIAIALAWDRFGWKGVAVVATVIVMWMLLHFNRLMQVLRRAADRPVGHVDSAVMLNAKLRKGMTLMHVTAMTRSLGKLQSEPDQQPETYRWADNAQSRVDCEFDNGRLVSWELFRPQQSDVHGRQDAVPGAGASRNGP